MTQIKPFKALIYNQEKIKDLSCVVCPPYDIISPHQQQRYHEANPYNFIHILLGKDVPGENKYRRAANLFKDWLKDKVLIQDEKPAMYFYVQEYNIKGEKRRRSGFIALLHLQDKNISIFGHEHTRLEPKEDRLRLMKRVKANLCPIFVLFYDKKRIIPYIHQHCVQENPPFIEVTDEEKTVHKLWKLDSQPVLDRLQRAMQGQNLFIADGHHRYEVSLAYRDEAKKKIGAATGTEGFNYLLAYFTNIGSAGLTILPIHRLVKLDKKLDFDNFKQALLEYFSVENVKDKTKFFFLMQKAGRTEHLLGMYKDKKYWLLRLKNIKILDKIMPDKPREYRLLDVSILNHIILNKIMGFDLEDKENIIFSPHSGELIEKVDSDLGYIAFFLNPVNIQQMIQVALSGQKMPAKSTYFYPKLLSGLVINKFDP